MKIHKPDLVILLLVASSLLSSCIKEKEVVSENTYIPPPPFRLNEVIYWFLKWQYVNRTQQILIVSPDFTDSSIAKGIKVSLAPISDWDSFQPLPMTIMGVEITYNIKPDTLRVVSKADSLFSYPSDIRIVFQ